MQKCIADYNGSQSQIDPFSRLLVTPIDAYKPKKMYLPEYISDYRAFIRVYIEKLRTLLDNQLKLNNPLQNLIDLFRQTLEKQLSALIYVKYEVDLNYIIDNILEQQSQLYFLLYDSYNDQKVLQLVKQNQINQCEDSISLLEKLLVKQKQKGNERLSSIESVIKLNRDFQNSVKICSDFQRYEAVKKMYERKILEVDIYIIK
ncbi:Conserved_hypothetical protein [Hexamita inflata]|uniref:Uncharacterized protein n=1 Tax=Hexamita inflata TaxID=28002 RepID=A0ABP1HLK2_9EUKA